MKDVLILKDSKVKVKVLVCFILFAIIYGVCQTNIYSADLVPFGIGIVFSLLYVNFNGYILAIIYAVAYVLASQNFLAIIQALNVSIVLILIQYLISKNKLTLKKWKVFLFALLSQMAFIVSNFGSVNDNLALFISILLGQIFLYTNLCFFNATLNRGMMVKLNLDEKICGSVLLIIFIVGLSGSNISIINLGLIVSPIILLVTTYISSGGVAIIIASLIGIGFSLTMTNPIYISLFVVMAICSISFKCNFKYLSILGVYVGYILYSIFFGLGISYGEVISVVLGGVVFAFIPLKLVSAVADIFNIKSQVLMKNIITKSKKQIMQRVDDLSRVFAEMDKVYRNMVKGTLADDKAVQMLKSELVSSVCDECPNKLTCFRGSNSFVENSLDTIISIGYEKGKILLIDLPSYLTSNCIKVNQLINNLNTMLISYKQYTGVITNLDMSRILIADQLNGVSKLLASLSKEVDTNISFESVFENRIKEELSYKDIVCLECIVYEKDINDKNISLIVKTETINEKIIEKIVGRVLNNKLIIKSIEPSEIIGASVLTMVTRPNYDIAFGSSTITKTGGKICGDSQSLVKLDDGKFMISICDGMGSGASAKSISNLTINLIENFYRAGFDNDVILSSVNKLLSLTEEENFSTIDLCIIDGKKNIYDFIKLGATTGYLKRYKGICEEINSSGLPVGMLEEISPHITKKLIDPFDMLVFVSDGISDSFEDKCDLRMFIESADIINPQTLSDEILHKALSLNGNIANDDMTVICVRVFSNY